MEDFLNSITWWGWISSLAFISLQLFFFYKTMSKLYNVNSIFPKDVLYQKKENIVNKDCTEIICMNGQRQIIEISSLKLLINELNDYIKKNLGTTDFSIMQHKTDRYVDAMFEDAVSRISFPTYLGLMGTFLGVLIGLSSFNITDGSTVVTDEKISNLINGVLVSMFTSLMGLLLSTWSNGYAAYVKKNLDDRRNRFYEFLQNELMPELGTSMVSALAKLRTTINRFEPSFNKVIDRFQETFEQCTNSFGSAFRENVQVVSNAVETMGENMSTINETVKNQKELITVLKSNALNKTLDKFISTTNQFDNLTVAMTSLYQIKEDIVKTVQTLIVRQKEYNESLSVPQTIAENLNLILDRINNFEQNINGLGESIAQTQMIGNREMNLIERQLNIINVKNKLAENYADIANEELENLFKNQVEAIEQLNKKYKLAIGQHADELECMIDDMSKELKRKWGAFSGTLESSFDIKTIQIDFGYLQKLQVIDEKLASIEEVTKDKSVLERGLNDLKELLSSASVVANGVTDVDSGILDSAKERMELSPLMDKSFEAMEKKVSSIYGRMGTLASIEVEMKNMRDAIESIHVPVVSDKAETNEYQTQLSIERGRVQSLRKQMDTLKNALDNDSTDTVRSVELEHLKAQLGEKDKQIVELQHIVDETKKKRHWYKPW